MNFWYLLFLLFALGPAFGIARDCVERVLRAPDERQDGALFKIRFRIALAILALALMIFLASAVSGSTGRSSDVTDTFVWLTFKSGMVVAVAGWVAPLIVTRRIVAEGGGSEAARRVWVAPLPFLAAALAIAWFFGVRPF